MTDTADIRRCAITEIYKRSNRELAQEVDALKQRLEVAEKLLFKITRNELCHCAVDGENCYIEQAKDYLAARREK
jgi:hypothetical protein